MGGSWRGKVKAMFCLPFSQKGVGKICVEREVKAGEGEGGLKGTELQWAATWPFS